MSRLPPANIQPNDDGGDGFATTSDATMTSLFQVMGHRPALMEQARQLLETAMREGTVDAKLKELLAVRVSQVNHCFY
ncbi:MAG TPA: carboxymuconolactone decarboxylase family protein [Ktedonosporobacter sp.]|nr:carboxymuconolactone decarboxylase family protein [Ktedonosporobacter sp.]